LGIYWPIKNDINCGVHYHKPYRKPWWASIFMEWNPG
jgi:hypothetical protein